jgi:hypothetical protein
MKKTLMPALCLLAGLLTACSTSDQPVPATTPTPIPTLGSVATPTPMPAPTVLKTETKNRADGSEVVTTYYSDNSKREVRTFKKGALVSVERKTSADGTVNAKVVRRADNSEIEVNDKSWIDKSMDATGDALATAASKAKDVGEKVGDTTKEAAKDVGGAVKEGAEKTGSAAEKGAKEAGKGAKKVGETVKKTVTN